jgi:hypothetical protein
MKIPELLKRMTHHVYGMTICVTYTQISGVLDEEEANSAVDVEVSVVVLEVEALGVADSVASESC